MVRVITIRDDVYERLKELKESKNMSFSKVIDYLLRSEENSRSDILKFAGCLDRDLVSERRIDRLLKEFGRGW